MLIYCNNLKQKLNKVLINYYIKWVENLLIKLLLILILSCLFKIEYDYKKWIDIKKPKLQIILKIYQ